MFFGRRNLENLSVVFEIRPWKTGKFGMKFEE